MTAALGTADVVIWGVITFSILVVFHEMGHLLAARAFGVKVHEFMVGLPGPALRLHTKNMAWGVTAIPLGGYVRISGMEPGAEDELLGSALVVLRDHGPTDAAGLASALGVSVERAHTIALTLVDWKAVLEDGDRLTLALTGELETLDAAGMADRARSTTYRGQSTWKRVVILAAGVVTNLTVAILTFTIVLSVWGYLQLTTTIDTVGVDTPAAAADVRAGDTLLALDGEPIESWDSFQLLMSRTKPEQSVTLTVERGGSAVGLPLVLGDKDGHGYAGIGPTAVPVRPSVIESLGESVRLTGLVFRAIVDLFNPTTFASSVQGVRGPVGISVMAAEAAAAGPLSYAGLIAMLSLSLGIMNILPLPPLDGGKIVLEIAERVIGRPISRTISLGLSAAGAVLLFSLIGYIMYADIARLAQ
ncbi:MAG: M50 family metallopeptidase [Coriobacteriia bacterium]|nr:M50 family metallopeptidase [Coriobacteriia bacterium]